ncbi:isochorismatase family protein [Dactylosporangium sp. NPDC005555]|uniref:isochorismatase family protein n=1 Tax=Dactylosporangium sp. NPDC005555 TaxID=3154889 RepID=UPI0033A0F5B3
MLPRITAYQVPTDIGRGTAKAGWRLDPARAVLLVHDMQNYFLAPFGTSDRALLARVIDNIATLRKHAAEFGIPVVYSAQPGGQSREERGLLRDFWGDGPPADPRALAIVDALTPGPSDVVLTKRRYSAFVGTPLADILGGRDQLVITGVYAHIGVLATALDAFMRGVQPFVVADGVADFSPADHRAALRHVNDRCGVVALTSDLADDLRRHAN